MVEVGGVVMLLARPEGAVATADALDRAVGRHGAEAALAAHLHARLDEATPVPAAYRDRLLDAVNRAIGLARAVGADPEREADARRATSALYHPASAALLAWEAWRYPRGLQVTPAVSSCRA